MKKIIHTLGTTVALIGAFLCGMFFGQDRAQQAQMSLPARVYLEQLKTKMNIRREWEVEIYLNSQKVEDDTTLDIK